MGICAVSVAAGVACKLVHADALAFVPAIGAGYLESSVHIFAAWHDSVSHTWGMALLCHVRSVAPLMIHGLA